MDNTKVLLWHWGRRGGGPKYTYELAKALQYNTHLELSLSLSRQCDILSDFDTLAIPRFDMNTYSGISSAVWASLGLTRRHKKFHTWLSQQRFDIVICTMSHLWNSFMTGSVGRTGASYILVLHDAVPHPGENYFGRKWLLSREIQASDGIVALSESVRNTLVDVYTYPKERTWVIPHGAFAYHVAEGPRRFPYDREFRILFFGRVLPYKGLALLLAAYRRLKQQGLAVNLTIAGPGDMSPYLSILRDLPDITVDNRWIPEGEIAPILADADLVVAPYVEASQSGVIATAFASALPVVATPVGGLIEQISNEKNGLISADVTECGLAEALRRFFDQPRLYEKCSFGALETTSTTLSWSSVAGDFAKVIDKAREITWRRVR